MSKYYRYSFVKNYYPNYLVFIKDKNKLITYNYDLKIVKLFNYKLLNINYLILDNVDIIKTKEYHNNKYLYYFKICILLDFLDLYLK